MSSTSKFKGGKRKKNRLENFSSSRSLFPLLSTFLTASMRSAVLEVDKLLLLLLLLLLVYFNFPPIFVIFVTFDIFVTFVISVI